MTFTLTVSILPLLIPMAVFPITPSSMLEHVYVLDTSIFSSSNNSFSFLPAWVYVYKYRTKNHLMSFLTTAVALGPNEPLVTISFIEHRIPFAAAPVDLNIHFDSEIYY